MIINTPDGQCEVTVDCNVADSGLFSNVSHACSLGLPTITQQPEKSVPAVICGSGPSLKSADSLENIRKLQDSGAIVYALNNTAKFLSEHGITADYQVLLDARKENIRFIESECARELLLASQCHPDIFAAAEGRKVSLWHPLIEGINDVIKDASACLIGGGTTVGLSGLCLAYTMGFRAFHLFGYDSCHAQGEGHAFPQPMNDGDQLIDVIVNGREFKASVAMVAQAQKFPHLSAHMTELGCEFYMHGDGLLQEICKQMMATSDEKILHAVYDLSSSPPTYEFVTFLAEAEKYRAENGYSRMDVIFQPGPKDGFRNDNLPPDSAERSAMLRRICIPACWLTGTVRDVSVLSVRKNIDGDVFPVGWSNEHPKSHYGVRYIKDGHRCLKATEASKREIKRRFSGPYATITIRQAEYWPKRNSDFDACMAAAKWFMGHGIAPVIIPDTHGDQLHGFHNFREAALDIDLRMAAYEGAAMNIGVTNGPMVMCMLSNAPYMVFKIIANDESPANKAEFLAAHGINVGDQFSVNGRTIWADDTEATVIQSLNDWFKSHTQPLEEIQNVASSRI